MVRSLVAADTAAALALLRAHSLRNVFLEHLVRNGALGVLPGFLGFEQGGELGGLLLVMRGGSTALDVVRPAAFGPLAKAAAQLPIRPLHIVGDEEVTVPFWQAYGPHADPVVWCRREPLYLLSRPPALRGRRGAALERASERDLDEVAENSALQYREDLKLDRRAEDPSGFRERHRMELRDGRWWIVRERGRIVFQVHVGPHNASSVQVGGVFTPADLRGRGRATRGMAALAGYLLSRHPAVSLFCDESNAAARRVYERVGFEPRLHYCSWLLRPAGSAPRLEG